MKIVIDIDEKDYKRIKEISEVFNSLTSRAYKAIRNGTPLPEHHGRIIDESQIKHIECHTEQELCGTKIRYVKTTDAPTIIEADTEGSDEK